MDSFHCTNSPQEVIFGAGEFARLGEAIERYGWRRVMLCSGGSQRRSGALTMLESALGERLVALYEGVQAHVPAIQVAEALAQAEQHQVDALIGLGGGSSLGLAKAVSFALGEKRGQPPAGAALPFAQPLVPVIAIPTTYAGSEMTPVYGITRQIEGQARKVTVNDPRILPRLVIYDPQLTLDLPPAVTASTGINALAHCVEALYSPTRNPLSSAAALNGMRAIFSALPRCYATGDELEARSEMLVGAYLAGSSLAHVSMALHHGLCHVLGGTAGIAHGVANSIILPHAMRFNLATTAPLLAPAAEAVGISLASKSAEQAVEELIERIEYLIQQMNLPSRLRNVGVDAADLPNMARLAFENRTVQNNPTPISAPTQIEALLQVAW